MSTPASLLQRASRPLAALAIAFLTAPAALAGGTTRAGTAMRSTTALQGFLESIANLFTGPVGIAIGVIAFAASGIYIMYARQTGQAVGAIAKVFVGLLILFGGTALVSEIGTATGGAF